MPSQLTATAGTTRAFELARGTPALRLERIVISDAPLSALRVALRRIIGVLCDSEEDELCALATRLQFALGEWLTSPCQFGEETVLFLRSVLGELEDGHRRWGKDIAQSFIDAISAAEALSLRGNRLRQEVGAEVRRLLAGGRTFRIYCRRADKRHFEDAAGPNTGLQSLHFIHTVREYREASIFDVLLKVGPFRTAGIASTPEALLNAPKFFILEHYVWDKLSDEDGFAADVFEQLVAGRHEDAKSADTLTVCGFSWHIDSLSLPDESGWTPPGERDASPSIDDLNIAPRYSGSDPLTRAMLVRIGQDHGLLYPRKGTALVVDGTAAGSALMAQWIPSEEVREDMFLVFPDVEECDVGALVAEPGQYGRQWKRLLRDAIEQNRTATVRELARTGIDLISLGSAVDHWAKPSSSVIHAPQREQHFMMLMKVLANSAPEWKEPLWKLAWQEIRRSRGEAIVAGVLEHEKLRERLVAALGVLSPMLQERVPAKQDFVLYAPRGSGVSGVFTFKRVAAVEDGFRAPDREMRMVRHVNTFQKWLF